MIDCFCVADGVESWIMYIVIICAFYRCCQNRLAGTFFVDICHRNGRNEFTIDLNIAGRHEERVVISNGHRALVHLVIDITSSQSVAVIGSDGQRHLVVQFGLGGRLAAHRGCDGTVLNSIRDYDVVFCRGADELHGEVESFPAVILIRLEVERHAAASAV